MGKHLVNGMPSFPEVGDVYFDVSDGKVKVPGMQEVHEFGGGGQVSSFEPKWYGTVTSQGTATKLGGTENLICAMESTGKYRFYKSSGTIAASAIIVTPLLKTTLNISPVLHTPVVIYSTSKITVCMFDREGVLSNYAFSILIL